MTWKKNHWEGDNIKGRSNRKVIKLLERIDSKNPFNAHSCYIMCKRSEWNKQFKNTNFNANYMNTLWNQGIVELKVLLKDGTIKNGSDYLHLNYFPATRQTYDGYDLHKSLKRYRIIFEKRFN